MTNSITQTMKKYLGNFCSRSPLQKQTNKQTNYLKSLYNNGPRARILSFQCTWKCLQGKFYQGIRNLYPNMSHSLVD